MAGRSRKTIIENNELAAEIGQAKRVGWAKQAPARRVYKESVMPRGFASRNGLRGCTKRRVPIEEARRRARQPCRARAIHRCGSAAVAQARHLRYLQEDRLAGRRCA